MNLSKLNMLGARGWPIGLRDVNRSMFVNVVIELGLPAESGTGSVSAILVLEMAVGGGRGPLDVLPAGGGRVSGAAGGGG